MTSAPEAHKTAGVLEWRCFHCNDVFTSEREARLHFGRDECSVPACQIKGSEGGLVEALRRAEDDAAEAWAAVRSETVDAVTAYHAQAARHREQIRALEQVGYDRGLADAKAHPEALGLTLSTPSVPAVAELSGDGLARRVAGAAEATIQALRTALRPFSQAILPDQTTLSGWRFGFEPSHDDFLHARAVYYGTDSVALQTAAERDVLAERRRQVDAEGWTPEHDDEHKGGELADAAACYAATAAGAVWADAVPSMWPWDRSWWKPRSAREDLVRAGALILAEIERLDRAALEGKTNG